METSELMCGLKKGLVVHGSKINMVNGKGKLLTGTLRQASIFRMKTSSMPSTREKMRSP